MIWVDRGLELAVGNHRVDGLSVGLLHHRPQTTDHLGLIQDLHHGVNLDLQLLELLHLGPLVHEDTGSRPYRC